MEGNSKDISDIEQTKKSHNCSICDCKYSQKYHLKHHIESVHEGKKPNECMICNQVFSQKEHLKKHFERVHEGKKQTIAKICKSVWDGIACQTINCDRAHPQRCKNTKCFDRDQGLPRWRTLQCRNWHGRPRERRKNTKYSTHSQVHAPSWNSKTHWSSMPVNMRASSY